MSVYKSRRGTSTMEFIRVGQQLATYTMEQIKKFPKSYKFNLVSDLYRLSSEIHENVLRANAIYVSKNMEEVDFLLRRKYLLQAKSSVFAMTGLLTVTFNLMMKGNNFLGDKDRMSNMFQEWARLLNLEHKLIKGVIESDKKKWKSYKSKPSNNEESTKPVPINNEDIVDANSFIVE